MSERNADSATRVGCALILVDIQNDFLPGGALAVPHGDEVIAVAERLIDLFPLVIATRDWHPADHMSFVSQHPEMQVGDVFDLFGLKQIVWPDHCVEHTPGAELSSRLSARKIDKIVLKGLDKRVDGYSAFFDNAHRRQTELDAFLKEHSIKRLAIMGLATDYCVRATVLDACALGYSVQLVEDGCRGVELHAGDCSRALAEMRAAGAELVPSSSLLLR